LQWIEKGDFSPLSYMRGKRVKVIAIPLHWHQQAFHAIKAAREIRKERSDGLVVLGGYTASYFHNEILATHEHIDAVIRGDAEIPLLALMKAVHGKGAMGDVPNLTWRDGKEIRENPVSYVADERDLDAPSYARVDLLEHRETYIGYVGLPFIWSKRLSKKENKKRFHLGPPIFPLPIGRGCTGNCTWCGGGARAQYLVNGRKGVSFRSPERAA
ncbi:MAG: hypothetical protein GY849_08885, partial [Deltaproteobacteria bacterium]|nr:hypothetical protein [Deltaproteobacteria bacterium]